MVEPAKPFACTIPDCGMTFTNEDHLHVHTKKHDMILQLGAEQRASFAAADQTPTPTRFIRNCEEVGLFQDLQNVTVNPFDEGFKRAMETKQGVLSLDGSLPNDDVLHTPQMVFPVLETESAVYTSNNQCNVTISRSSSDESGTLKGFKTTTISKLTNEISTISRIVGNRDTKDKITDDVIKTSQIQAKDNIETVYKNIKIHSNVAIRKDNINVDNVVSNKIPVLIYTDTVIKDSVVTKDVLLADNNKLTVDKIPIMSQKSLDQVVDSLTSDLNDKSSNDKNNDNIIICNKTVIVDNNDNLNSNKEYTFNDDDNRKDNFLVIDNNSKLKNVKTAKKIKNSNSDTNRIVNDNLSVNNIIKDKKDDIEVIIKLPDGKKVHMKAVDDSKTDTKEVLRKTIESKKSKTNDLLTSPIAIPLPGTLIPITLLNNGIAQIPITNNVFTPKLPISLNPNNVTQVINVTELNLNSNVSKNFVAKLKNNNFNFTSNRSNSVRKNANLNLTNTTKDVEERLQGSSSNCDENNKVTDGDDDDCVIERVMTNPEAGKRTRKELESRNAASKRYRERLKGTMRNQSVENRLLKETNQRLAEENAVLKILITEHMKKCPNADDLRISHHKRLKK